LYLKIVIKGGIMPELSKEEVLLRLDTWKEIIKRQKCWISSDEQAYQQIRKLIEKAYVEVGELLFGKENHEAQKERARDKPKVSKEFVEKWAKQSLFIPAEKSKSRLIEMLQEAGVEVEE